MKFFNLFICLFNFVSETFTHVDSDVHQDTVADFMTVESNKIKYGSKYHSSTINHEGENKSHSLVEINQVLKVVDIKEVPKNIITCKFLTLTFFGVQFVLFESLSSSPCFKYCLVCLSLRMRV